MPGLLEIYEQPPTANRQFQCVEIYLPKRLKHLSELYDFLRSKVAQRLGALVLDGLSIYEVDGVFRGAQQLWEERTLIIRILLQPSVEQPPIVLQAASTIWAASCAWSPATRKKFGSATIRKRSPSSSP
jgi:hypothetical protein